MPRVRPQHRLRFELRIYLLALGAGLPALVLALWLLALSGLAASLRGTLEIALPLIWLAGAWALRQQVVRPLQTLSNLLASLREGDYSVQSRGARHDDALGEVLFELNALARHLHAQRLEALEAGMLLRKVMAEVDMAVMAFDADDRLRLLNPAAERLLDAPLENLRGRRAADLGLGACLEGEPARTLSLSLPGGSGRWEMRRGGFREHGLPLQLLLLSDLSRALREEERHAWQRLLRVIGHELNNSLAPIKSIAASLEQLLQRQPPPADWRDDMHTGLNIISARSAALARFVDAYTRLARLPPPQPRAFAVGEWVHRVAHLETRLAIEIEAGPELILLADPDQMEQLLINLIRNAADAALETGGGVRVRWRRHAAWLQVEVEDEGPGMANPANVFVPFFTTKPGGSGVGLVLSRQIAEAHHGLLTLENRHTAPGCRARLELPLAGSA